MIEFIVPGEVRGQARPRATMRAGHATVYERAEDKSYKGLIQFYALKAADEAGITDELPFSPEDMGFTVEIWIDKGVPKSYSKKKTERALSYSILPQSKPDLDNVAKIVLDALNGVLWKDDSAVTDLRLHKRFAEVDSLFVRVMRTQGGQDGKA